MKNTLLIALVIGSAAVAVGQNAIYLDNFNRSAGDALGTTSTGSLSWQEVETVPSGLRLDSDRLQAGSTTSGREYAFVDLSSSPGFHTVLANNAGTLTWSLNLRQTRPDPSGFSGANYGVAFLVATSTSTDLGVGEGYALVLGQTGTTDALRLASFAGGVMSNSNFTTLISGGDFGTEYLSVRLTLEPSTSTWSLYAESDPSDFPLANPGDASSLIGSIVDATHTGTSLAYSGLLWNHATGATEGATFDQVGLSMQTVPEPELGWAIAIGLGALLWRRKRRPQQIQRTRPTQTHLPLPGVEPERGL